MYRRGTLRDYEANTSNSPMRLVSKAVFVLCRPQAVPPLSEYEVWLAAACSSDSRGKTSLTGTKLRRAVIMKRSGQTDKDIALVIGLSGSVVGRWLAKLPLELAA